MEMAAAADLNLTLPEGVELKWLTPVDGDEALLPLSVLVPVVGSIAVLLPCIMALLFGPPLQRRTGALSDKSDDKPDHRVALVVAHPDDEAMFFWPTLQSLHEAGVPLSVLCLSTGNFDGLGETRVREMRKSCARLGVCGEDIVILDLEGLQDGFWDWPEHLVAARVRAFLHARPAHTVLTFDDLGVSGHPNHVAASRGARRACDEGAAEGGASAFELLMLESAPLLRKYIGPLSLWEHAFVAPEVAASCARTDPLACLRALACHWSQLVWYRALFALFSRYAFVNTYVRHEPTTADAARGVQAETPPPAADLPRRRR